MNELPPTLRDQEQIDSDQIKLLRVFHFVGAGLGYLGLLFIFAHFAAFRAILENPALLSNKQPPPPPGFFVAIKILYVLFGTWFVASAVLNLLSGLFLSARKHRTFSLVVAALNCLHMPLGTILGVFTIVVLMRDSVRRSYERNLAGGH